MVKETQGKKNRWNRAIRIIFRGSASVLLLVVFLLIAVNIPVVQTFFAGKIINSIREKTSTEFTLGSIRIALPNSIIINDLFLSDKNADTLLYLHSLDIDVSLFGLLSNEVAIKSLALENVVANIHRTNSDTKFNFQFLIDVFASDTSSKPDTVVKVGKPWLIKVNHVNLKNIRASFVDASGGTDMHVNLGDFDATLKDIDLGKQKINVDAILLRNTSVAIVLSPKPKKNDIHDSGTGNIVANTVSDTVQVPSSVFLAMNISANLLTIENTGFRLDNNSSPKLMEGIDYQHMDFSNLNAGIRNISIDSVGYRADFQSLSMTESCGLGLKRLVAEAQFTDTKAELKNLTIETSGSNISGEMSLAYPSFNGFLSDLWNSETAMDLKNSSVNANEIFQFVPFLKSDSYIGKLKNTQVLISAKADGKINDLNIENLELAILDKTILKSKCRLKGIPDMSALVFDASIYRLSTSRTDIFQFVEPSVFTGINLPPLIEVKASAKGKISSVNVSAELKSAFGNIMADAFFQDNGSASRDTFSIHFDAENILAGIILADTSLGKTSFSGNASGTGISSNDVSGKVHLDIHDAQYNAYSYKNIQIDGQMAENIIAATASSADTNLCFTLVADADLRNAKHKYAARLDLTKANLKALNLTQKELAVSTNFRAEASFGGLQDADAHLELITTTITTADKSLPVESLEIWGSSATDSLRAEIKSDFLDGVVTGNIPPEKLGKTLLSAYNKYFGLIDSTQPDPGKQLSFALNVHIPEDILKFFSPKSEELNISHMEGEYSSGNNELSAKMIINEAMFSGFKLDSLMLTVKGKNENLSMNLSLSKLSYDTLRIENINIKEAIDKGVILSELSTLDTLGKVSYLFANKIESGPDFFEISFLPGGLILDKTAWKVEEGNRLEKRNSKLEAEQFLFSNGDQSIEFKTDEENQRIIFDNFAIQNLINIITLSGERRLFQGKIEGEIVFPASGTNKFMNADMAINNLYFQDSLIGNAFFNMKTVNDRMDIESRIENFENKVNVSGDIEHLSGTPELNLTAIIDINNLSRFEQFTFGYLSAMEGKINGEISVKGTTLDPDIKGIIGFKETVFRVNSLNFLAKINDEEVQLDMNGIHFTDFVIEDAEAKKLTVNGDILTSDFSDTGFDLHITTKDFQPINSTVADNPLFYGKLSLDTDVKLKGTIKNPEVKADLKINKATDLTYALPGSELQLVTSEGVVEFLDPTQVYDSLLTLRGDYLTDSIMSRLTGLDLKLNLEIDPEARFTIDVDPKSGDFLAVSGGAKLNIAADANGKQSITGIYEVKTGIYQLSFYGLVKKTFTIAPGSTVSWSGRPMDADLDITAEYEVRTSSVSLVANETAEMSDAEKQTFNKRLPYMVKLNIRGFLAEPEISFNIDLPEKYLLTYPLVATKLAVLNSEENKAELNKQVFALLVTGSFMADNPLTSNSSSPTNIATTAARNSVNGILADQLNNVSSKYITGVDVDFGLTSYEDFEEGSGDIRTEMDIQLSKKLFNDRITVEALGSFDLEGKKNNASGTSSKTMTNEFAVIYQLSENGEYKLRAYYEDAYDLFDGDIRYSGIALIFEKEFETLKKKKKVKNEK